MTELDRSVSAIVPAYNERTRIDGVLDVLVRCPEIHEIIVVDDGSEPPLTAAFPKVRIIRHARNRGKAAALETGVASASGTYLFFCDADLVGLAPEHVRGIIGPVLTGTSRMHIGIRANPEQKMVHAFALNSGERCLHKEDWDQLPRFYKKGFRVESGLNSFIARRGPVRSTNFTYRQTLRERKYGLRWGLYTRIILAWDVACAWGFAFLVRVGIIDGI